MGANTAPELCEKMNSPGCCGAGLAMPVFPRSRIPYHPAPQAGSRKNSCQLAACWCFPAVRNSACIAAQSPFHISIDPSSPQMRIWLEYEEGKLLYLCSVALDAKHTCVCKQAPSFRSRFFKCSILIYI